MANASIHSGFFGKGDMQKEFEEASFALKPGEISQVVQTASGLHLIERYVSRLTYQSAQNALPGKSPVAKRSLCHVAQRGTITSDVRN